MASIEKIEKTAKTKHARIIKNAIRRSLKPYIGDRSLISGREFWLYLVGDNKPIRWVKSYKTLLKYISEKYADIFKPKIKGTGSGTRYYIEVDRIVDFLYLFDNNALKPDKKDK